VTIGDGASLGPGVTVMTHNRFNFNPFLEKRLARLCGRMPVTIGPGAGIKAHALILHGVTIGAEAVVAGGAIVVKDVPPRTWVTGSPAVVKMTLD
jgi:acetyltransferase-like isoleucine patch superfamily enzyme